MYVCPQCDFELPRHALRCSRCDAIFDEASAWEPVYKPSKPWKPNEVAAAERIGLAIFCLVGLGYAVYSLYIGSFYLPNKRGSGATLRGIPAYIMSAAVLVGVAHFASLIVDHYDRRNNEDRYTSFATTTKYLSYGLIAMSLLISCASSK